MSEKQAADVGSIGGNLGSVTGGGRCASEQDVTMSPARCQERLPIVGPAGKIVAVIVDGTLTKTVDGSRHFLKSPPAIAFDAGAIAEAEALGVTQIVVTDRESGRTYRASLSDFYAHSWRFSRGYGAQLALRLTRWTTDGAPTAPAPAATAPSPVVVQLGLWG